MSYNKNLTDGCSNRAEQNKHETDYGGFNDPLPNMKEITYEDFACSGFFIWPIQGHEYRQIDPVRMGQNSKLSNPLPKWLLASQVFYVGSPYCDGYVLINDQTTKTIRYFTFAKCHHVYREIGSEEARKLGRTHFGNCYHIEVCTKCHVINERDSSD
jgi:hypothetical protein